MDGTDLEVRSSTALAKKYVTPATFYKVPITSLLDKMFAVVVLLKMSV